MKKSMVILCAMLLTLAVAGMANADLIVIGTATYNGSDYKLIYEDTQDLVWLDYTEGYGFWGPQDAWASGLGSNLTVTLYSGYTTSTDWSTGWRLPSTDESKANLSGGFGYQGPDQSGYHNYEWGYNMVNSEMGHLFYVSLGNKGEYATDGTHPQPGYGLKNTAPFGNLQDYDYWSGQYSLNSNDAWFFKSSIGAQREGGKGQNNYALAVHDGHVNVGPIVETIQPIVNISPDTFVISGGSVKNPKEPKDIFIDAYIEFLDDADANDVDLSTVSLSKNGQNLAWAETLQVIDNTLHVRFRVNFSNLSALLSVPVTKITLSNSMINATTGTPPTTYSIDLMELDISGAFLDGTKVFTGKDVVRIMVE